MRPPGGSGGIWPCYAPLPERWPGPEDLVAGLLMGLGEGHEPLASPWDAGSTLVVAGPARSGRSAFLDTVAAQLTGHRVIAVRPGSETELAAVLAAGTRQPQGARATTVLIDDADRLPPEAPRFDAGQGRVKTSAAWLIDHAGFGRGYGSGPARLSTKHTLALTNRGGASTADLLALAAEVQTGVLHRFGVRLEPEPVLVGCRL